MGGGYDGAVEEDCEQLADAVQIEEESNFLASCAGVSGRCEKAASDEPIAVYFVRKW